MTSQNNIIMKKNLIFEIQNLKCSGCANTIVNGLSRIEEVEEVIIDVEESKVNILCESKDGISEKISQKLRGLGYPLKGEDNSGLTKANSYVSCAIGKFSKS